MFLLILQSNNLTMSERNQKQTFPTPQKENGDRGGERIEKSQPCEPLHENAIPDFEFTPPPPPPPPPEKEE